MAAGGIGDAAGDGGTQRVADTGRAREDGHRRTHARRRHDPLAEGEDRDHVRRDRAAQREHRQRHRQQRSHQQQRGREDDERDGGAERAPLVPDPGGEVRRRQPGHGAPDAQRGVDEAGCARVAGRGGQHRRPGLGGAEEHPDAQLGQREDDQRGAQQPPGTTEVRVREGVGVGADRRLVEREGGAEDRQQGCPREQRAAGVDGHGQQADEGRAQGEGGLVGGALVGERGVDQAGLVDAAVRQRPPPHPRERPDLRHGEAGERGDEDGRGGRAADLRDQRDEAGRAEQRLDEHDGALPDAVGEAPGDGGAERVGDGEGAGGEAAEAVAAGGGRDEQQGAELAHGQRQPAEEGDEDVAGAGEVEESLVGGEGAHRGPWVRSSPRRTHHQVRV